MPEFDSIQVGDEATLSRHITEQDVADFAKLSGDYNPLHIDEAYASQTRFGKRVVHGFLVSSFISTMIGTILPGNGALYMGQDLKFKKPVFIDDIIEVKAQVIQKIESSKMMEIKTVVTNQDQVVVITGTAKVTWAR